MEITDKISIDDRELETPGPVTAECRKVWAEREAADVDP